MVSVGLLSGPVVGGFITQLVGWRWAFYVNAPVALLATVVGLRLLRPSVRAKAQPFDLRGAVLLVVGSGLTLLGVTQGSDWGWSSPELATTLGVGLASIVARSAGPNGQLPAYLTPELLLISAGAVFSLCMGAGLVALRKVAKTEPAMVFK